MNPESSLLAQEPEKKELQAVLFDLDGTLLDTETLSDEAIVLTLLDLVENNDKARESLLALNFRVPWECKKKLLGKRGVEWIPIVLEYASQHWAISTDDLEAGLKQATQNDRSRMSNSGNPLLVHWIWNAWEQHLNELCENVKPCLGAAELVSTLVNSQLQHPRNLPLLAIATSSRANAVQHKRKHYEDSIFQYMSTIVTGDDPNVRQGKPAPDIYLQAMANLNIQDPSTCIVVEDAVAGCQAGQAAGCFVVAIPDPRYSLQERQDLFAPCAHVVLSSLADFRLEDFPFAAGGSMSASESL
jgi:beta-phosphoglucomutase-like phosphatase (HAD superfamily)